MVFQDAFLEKFSHTKFRLMDAYHEHRTYYDKKAAAKPLANQQFCFLLNPSLPMQSDFAAEQTTFRLLLHKVDKFLKKSNYLVQRVGAPYTQCNHRIQLRPITHYYDVHDISVTVDDFQPDTSSGKNRSEHKNFKSALEQPFEDTTFYRLPDITLHNKKNTIKYSISYVVRFGGSRVAAPTVAPVVASAGAPPQADASPVIHGPGDAP